MSKEKQSKPAGKAPVIVVSILLAIALIVNVVCIQMFAAINAFMAANLDSRLPGAHGSATAEQLTPDQAREAALAMAQELAAEGIVLLENRDNALPLEGGSKVNLFGFSSISPLYGGTGSGASDTSSNVDLVQGLTNAGLEVNQELVDFYKNSGVKRGDQAGFTGSNFTPAEVSANTAIPCWQTPRHFPTRRWSCSPASAARAATCPWTWKRRATARPGGTAATWSSPRTRRICWNW